MRRCLTSFLLAGVAVLYGVPITSAADPVDFETQIKPVFQKYCVSCHGPDEQESGFRIDFGSLLLRGGDRGAAVVPGKASESLLYKVLITDGDISQMPEGQPPLSDELIALIKDWIDQGAKAAAEDKPSSDGTRHSSHWAFRPVRQPVLPNVQHRDWPRNGIDWFVLERLEQEGLTPSDEANRSTLIRRVSLDLLGVLPTPTELSSFLADSEPDAYERLVDRLLASPRYGERWGRHWLDIARYADSNGFTIDGPRSIWPYRDWVIRAINDDKPFDQFVIEQLAGDLLPGATRDQLVATGFHRNTLINQEGGTDQEQFRVESVVDRVNTTGAAFFGMTIGCAQCHAHKYDPFTQREFYELFAIFNNCDEPGIPLPDDQQAAAQARVKTELADVEKRLKEHDAARAAGQPDWETKYAALPRPQWTLLKPVDAVSKAGATLEPINDFARLVGSNGNVPAQDVYTVTADVPTGKVTAVKLEAINNPQLPGKGPGWAENGNFVLSEFEVTATPLGQSDAAPQKLELVRAAADWQQDGFSIDQTIDGDLKTGWAINGRKKSSINVPHEAIYALKQPLDADAAGGFRLTFTLTQNHSVEKYLIGAFQLAMTADPADQPIVTSSIQAALDTATAQRDDGQNELLAAAYGRTDQSRKPLEALQTKLKAEETQLNSAIPTTMVMRERKAPRETHIMIRGNFLDHGALVQPGVPAVLPPLAASETPASRLDFARWLFLPEQPLTSRVTVNRFWQQFFGHGIVETENDFGTQGDRPTHPELLDWLAGEFMRDQWSMKSLHRLMVTSATYRQSSRVTPELLERDPHNRLLARQSRVRLEAEGVRDVALTASNLLSQKMLGPGVYPPQPQGIYIVTQVSKQWPESKGDDRFRRALYTYFWRSSPYPMLPTFDAPDANGTCTRRNRSNTPLQALTLANDASFMEFAKAFSDRIVNESPNDDDDARIRLGFQAALARDPSDFELDRLRRFVTSQREFFQQNAAEAAHAASAARPSSADAATSATWTAFARVLLNVDEFITRE